MSLTEIKAAGYKLAEIQYPIFVKKRDEIKFTKKEEKKENEKKKENIVLTKEKVLTRKREAHRMKHDLQRSEREIKARKDRVMRELYFGLVQLDIPEEYTELVNSGNPTMDGVNYYNVLIAMREALLENYPEEFYRYK